MSQFTAAIIIPHYNDDERLSRCLDALAPQRRDDVEILVVDNASPNQPHIPDWVVLKIEPGKGAALARNTGVLESTAPLLFFVDSDCVPAPNWIDTALRVANSADLVGGTVTVFDETPPPRSGAEAFEAVFAFDFKTYIEKKGFSGSGNLVTHREVFEAIGGFRPGMSEDLEWCHRATSAGFSLIHADELRVAHPTRQDWPSLKKKWHRVTKETWGLKSQSGLSRAKWVLRAFAMPASALLHLPKILRHPDLSWWEKCTAAATLLRLRLIRMGWMLRQATE